MTNFCLCYSEKEYQNCCKPFHKGMLPKNALLLMRSRYCAYALNLPDYIIETTHPLSKHVEKNTSSWKQNISQFSKNSLFKNLKIHHFQEKGSIAIVVFTAYLSQKEQDISFTELSFFEKIENRWLYRDGQITKGIIPPANFLSFKL